MPEPSLLQRLKERKLVQWAVAYSAGAFVVFQAVEVMAEPWGISPALQRAVHILLVIGLFVTIVLAWYHGERGRQRVSGPELLMVAALLVVAGATLTLVRPRDEGLSRIALEGDDRPGIAVFPCENWSPEPEDAYFASGIHDEILLHLQRISGLRSIGRESMEWYKANPSPVRQIAQELSVGFFGECSVLKDVERNQIRLTFQLLDGNTGAQIWAERYDEDLSARSIFDIHTDVARRVAREVGAVITPEEDARLAADPTTNTEAHEEYLKGRFHWSTRTAQGLETAIGHFQRAIGLDPTFALAYSGLADCYTLLNYFSGDVNPTEMFRRGEEAAQEAIRLAPDLAAAHASLGYLRLLSRRDWTGAEQSLRHAIFLDPTYPPAHQWLADLLADSGRFEESYREGQRAIELDPLSFSPNYSQAARLTTSRNFGAAITQYERTIELYPQYFLGWAGLANALLAMGDIEGAVRNMARSDELFGIDPILSETHLQMAADFHRTGNPGRLLPAYDTVSGFLPDWRASSAMWVGDTAKALEWLERAAAENWPDLLGLRSYFLWDPLREHPRFQALVEDYFGVRETSLSREP
ncbi:hypothetical protein ACFL3S_07605 [Gemmatimonadota bacterium]